MSFQNLAGQHLGQYELRDLLGAGGMGAVYRAFQTNLRREVAVKVLPHFLARQTDYIERFQQEAHTAARLEHAHIVPIYDYGVQDGTAYVVMRLLDGGTLAERLATGKPDYLPSVGDITVLLKKLATALDYAHGRGVIHRDIKPSNVMFDRFGSPFLVDFGIAKLLNATSSSEITGTGMVLGTPSYMAPEQWQGTTIVPATDQYALGVMVYLMLTGELPFVGDTPFALATKHVSEPPPAPHLKRPEIPEAVSAVIQQVLAKESEKRFPNATAFATAFEQAIGGQREETQFFTEAILKPPSLEIPLPPPVPAPDSTMGGPEQSVIMAVETLMPNVQLTIMQSPDASLIGRTSKINGATFIIGRSDGDFQLGDRGVSKNHARITYADKTFYVSDLGSSNGTYVNGKRILPETNIPLMFNSSLTIGSTILRFVLTETPKMPNLEGQVLDDRYEVQELLNRTGKGAVYRAHDRNLRHPVAIKVLSPDLASHPGYLTQLRQEAETAATLRHSYIVKVYEFRTTGDINYIVMDLLDGGTLADRLEKSDLFSLEEIADILTKLAEALDYAHRKNVIHSGLKPSTVIFDNEGIPYITDFAIARSMGTPDNPTIVGAPALMAPEQWNNDPITPAADQYALAVLAYLMVTGGYPFEGRDYGDFRDRHLNKSVPQAHLIAADNGRAGVSRRVSEVLQRGMAKQADERFKSAGEFAKAFANVVGPAGIISDKPRVFLSYQRGPSSGWAVLIAKELEKEHDIAAFVDTRQLDGAMTFPKRLQNAIEDCTVFICLLADTTLESNWVQKEIKLAYELGKPMIPLFQEAYVRPEDEEKLDPHIQSLLEYEGVHVLDRKNIYIDEAIAKLAKMIKQSQG